MSEVEFFLPGPRFSWRERKKTHKGRCPKRGHCTVTKEGQHPETKGNRKQIVRRGAHSGITESKRAIAAEEALVAVLEAHPLRPAEPLGDVRLGVVFVFEPPASWPKWRRKAAFQGFVRATTGNRIGDRGNLLKMIEDALERAGWIENDARIVDGPVTKCWGLEQGYLIRLEELEPEPKTAKEWRALQAAQGGAS